MRETEASFVGFAWTVPWEKERHRRAVGLGNLPKGEHAEFRVAVLNFIRTPACKGSLHAHLHHRTVMAEGVEDRQ